MNLQQLNSTQQLEVLRTLTQGAAAQVAQVSPRTIREHVADLQPSPDSRYDIAAVVAWLEKRAVRAAMRGQFPEGDDMPDTSEWGNAAKRKFEQARADREQHRAELSRLDLEERSRNLIPRAEVHDALVRLAAIVRSTGSLAQQQFGDAGEALFSAMIDQFEREFETGQFADAPKAADHKQKAKPKGKRA